MNKEFLNALKELAAKHQLKVSGYIEKTEWKDGSKFWQVNIEKLGRQEKIQSPMNKLDQDRRRAATIAFQDYNFTPLEVVSSERWVNMGNSYRKVVYLALENKPSTAETFVVEFLPKASRIVSAGKSRN